MNVEEAASLIMNSEYLIALTGAGISKESKIPTFRGEDGLWRNYDPMQLATPSAFKSNPNLVWEWYSWRQNLIANCSPNPAHTTLARWEQEAILKALITQNVDGLHRKAGSQNVLEVHGDIWAVKCTQCSYRNRLVSPAESIPICPDCGSLLRPDVVWFGESLNQLVMSKVYNELDNADLCLVIGTSALVQPAASFPLVVKQHNGKIIEVNVEQTPLTPISEVHIRGKAGEALPNLDELIA